MERPSVAEWTRSHPGTLWLLGTMILFFLLELALGGPADPRAELRLGALRPDRVAEHREYWRLVMPLFLHHGWLHLSLCLAAGIQVASAVERVFGPRRLALYTVLCAVAASLVSATMRPEGWDMALGASGALLGLAGVLLG